MNKIIIAIGAIVLFIILMIVFSNQDRGEAPSPSVPAVERSNIPAGDGEFNEPTSPPPARDADPEPLPSGEFAEPVTPPSSAPGNQGGINETKDVSVLEETPEEPVKVIATENLAPEFTLPLLDGSGTLSLADYRGEKPVILDFFAPHCPNCRRNIEIQKPLYEQYKDDVEVIIISGIDPEKMNVNYFANNPVAMPIVYDHQLAVTGRPYKIRFTNTHVLINRDGSLEDILHGSDIHEGDFKRLLR